METRKGQIRDLNNRTVFREAELCAQFLRDYVDIDLLKDVKPEDIEDVSEKYQAYLGISFETDSVKKIRIRNQAAERAEDMPLYVISLVEHKSKVDYDVAMQLLRYMACIWHEYAKEAEKKREGNSAGSGFRYPPILPVVYYEGVGRWTAGLHLKDRIGMSEIFGGYVPDFTYKLVRNHDYTNEELLEKKDEMSLLMLINKVQTPKDMEEFLSVRKDGIEEIIRTAPEHLLEIIVSAVWSLCMKMNMPQEEAEECVGKVRERQMGYWFENMEKMDIQEERRNTAEARRELKEAREEAEEAREQLEETKRKLQKAERETEEKLQKAEQETIKTIISLCQEFGHTKETAVKKVMEKTGVSKEEAEKKVESYWE